MAHIGVFSLNNRIEVSVYYFVEVFCNTFCYFMQCVVIVSACLNISKLAQRNGSKIANGHFVFISVLDDLCAEVAALYCAKVLLVALFICCIFIEKIWSACLDLGVNYLAPEPLCLESTATAALFFVLLVESLKLFTPALEQAWTLVRTHEGPVTIDLNTLHE